MTNAGLTLFLLQVGVILGVTIVLGRIPTRRCASWPSWRRPTFRYRRSPLLRGLITMAVTTSMLGASVLRRILGLEQLRPEAGTVTAERVGKSLAHAGA